MRRHPIEGVSRPVLTQYDPVADRTEAANAADVHQFATAAYIGMRTYGKMVKSEFRQPDRDVFFHIQNRFGMKAVKRIGKFDSPSPKRTPAKRAFKRQKEFVEFSHCHQTIPQLDAILQYQSGLSEKFKLRQKMEMKASTLPRIETIYTVEKAAQSGEILFFSIFDNVAHDQIFSP
jgi:hypothetical protein